MTASHSPDWMLLMLGCTMLAFVVHQGADMYAEHAEELAEAAANKAEAEGFIREFQAAHVCACTVPAPLEHQLTYQSCICAMI